MTSVFLTAMPSIYEGQYHETTSIAGLHYIALGAGLTIAAQVNARYMDRIYIHFKRKNNGVGEPEFRLREFHNRLATWSKLTHSVASMVPGTIILPAGLFMAGWAAQNQEHWIITDIGIALLGAGMILLFQSIQTYIVDTFTLHAASGEFFYFRIYLHGYINPTPLTALAAVSCLRSLAGFGFPLFAPAMYNKLGYGKGNSILACVAIVLGCPAYVLILPPTVFYLTP